MASGYFILLHYFFLFIQSQERKTWFASVATLITAGVNIALNWLLIPRLGYLAAGWTTLVSYMLLFGLHIGVVRLWFKNDPVNDLRLMIALGGAITALAIFVSIVTV
jgi:O-antigen/teichoic acid export membrane protein